MEHEKEMDALDLAIYGLLSRKAYELSVTDDGTLYIEDDESMFQLSVGEIECMHKHLEKRTDEVHQPEPHSDYEIKYAYCPDCDEDVTDEVS